MRILFLSLCLLKLLQVPAAGQTYRNLINTRFNTVATGPMQAIIIDVPTMADTPNVRNALRIRVQTEWRARAAGLQRPMDHWRRLGILKPGQSPCIPDIVFIREKGRLVVPVRSTRANGEIVFTFPGAQEPGSWTPQQQAELQAILNVMYPLLKDIYGNPSWSGQVKIINGDNLQPPITDPNALSGGIYNASTNEILFRKFQNAQSTVFSLTQMMAMAFRGPASISYDAWERGMARAATMVAVRTALPQLEVLYGQGSIDVTDPLWHVLDVYDLLNQPPLGNDRFFPISKAGGQVNTPSFPLMLFDRLRMAGSAWLKVATEDPLFFRNFNAAYYQAWQGDNNIAGNIPRLKQLARQVLSGGRVEGLDFIDWYERQYVLDTSVSPGTKLYAEVVPLRPNSNDPPPSNDEFGFAVFLYYYQTTFDPNNNSDEINLNGDSYPIYWNFGWERLFLAAQYEKVEIRNGFGAVSPVFFDTINGSVGDPQLNGRMRVTMDFPVNTQNVRLYVAPRSMGKSDSPNNFWGAVVGANTGKIKIEADGIASQELDVKQGAFGGRVDPSIFSRPRRAMITFINAAGQSQPVRAVNIGYNEYAAVFYVADPIDALEHTFPTGPAMISFPIQPLRPKAAEALLNPATDQPLFHEGNLLLAQWRQNLQGTDPDDKYLRYPTLDPLTPGQGYWENFAQPTTVKIIGRTTRQDAEFSIGLLHGWNQIGSPYEQAVELSSLRFQYLADNVPVDLQTAIARGWIVAQNVQGIGLVAIWDFDPANNYIPATRLEPWKGYWIRVGVSEGLTITYPNPNLTRAPGRASPTRAATVSGRGWSMALTVRGRDGRGAIAYLGTAEGATDGFDADKDALRPPEFSSTLPTIAFHHTEWANHAGRYFSDIRRIGTRTPWEVTVFTPDPHQTYTLSWSHRARLPRTTRLILVDMATGRRLYMHDASSYSFTPGNSPTRVFQIVPEERSRSTLRILNVVVRPTRADGSGAMDIAYDLTQGATVSTEIRNASGRLIRRLNPGRAEPAGTNRILWDGRDDRAIAVPAGAYLVHITARTPEGEVARVVQPVFIVR